MCRGLYKKLEDIMKTGRVVITGLFITGLMAVPASAQEDIKNQVDVFNPPPGSYKEISEEEGRKMKNYSPADQKMISVTLERVSDKATGNKK
jgi:hypothetical protein